MTTLKVMTSRGAVELLLKRSSARRSLVISVGTNAKIEVAAPFLMPERDIIGFIQLKTDWIFKRLKESKRHAAVIQKKSYSHGEEFLFLGKKYPLKITKRNIKRAHISFYEETLHATMPLNLEGGLLKREVRRKLFKWYREQAEEILGGRIFYFSKYVGVEPKTIAVRTHKRIWGNCDYHTRTIHLNWQIILSPMDVIDYVVVHELCHLLVPDHSKRFWNKVEKVLPDFKERKKWLVDHWSEMVLPEVKV